MANLLGQNIGTNYKGILNLNTLNGNLSGTLESVTDGDGNASPLRLSTSDLAVTQSGNNRLLISTDITMRRNDNTLFFQYSNAPDVLELNGATIRLNTLRGNTAIGHVVASARLHVRGDGTNPVQRWQNGAGTDLAVFTNAGLLSFFTIGQGIDFYGQGIKFIDSIGTIDYSNAGSSTLAYHRFRSPSSPTTGNQKVIGIESNFGAAAGNATFRPLFLEYTINNSGAQTGTATGIFLNATETALNGMTHNLMDLQVGGVSRFLVSRAGVLNIGNNLDMAGSQILIASQNRIVSNSSGVIMLINNAFADFNRLQFGGTTNAFPALKRNGAALEVRLADDSAFANITANKLTVSGSASAGDIVSLNNDMSFKAGYYFRLIATSDSNSIVLGSDYDGANVFTYVGRRLVVGAASINASAILQADSTTKGFLPPRGSNAQMLAIATPATGLVFYDTTNNKLNVYDGTNWVAMH